MFIVFEIQTNDDNTVGTIVTTYTDQNQAESAYHTVLASAAVSALPVHSCALLTNEGFLMQSKCYKHTPEPEPEPEPEEPEA